MIELKLDTVVGFGGDAIAYIQIVDTLTNEILETHTVKCGDMSKLKNNLRNKLSKARTGHSVVTSAKKDIEGILEGLNNERGEK